MTTRAGSDDDLDEVAMSFVDELMAEAAQLSAEEAAQHPSAEAYALAARGRERIARMAMGDAAPAFASGSADDLATAAHDGSQAAIPIAFLARLAARAESGPPDVALPRVAVTRIGCDESDPIDAERHQAERTASAEVPCGGDTSRAGVPR